MAGFNAFASVAGLGLSCRSLGDADLDLNPRDRSLLRPRWGVPVSVFVLGVLSELACDS